MTLLVVCGLSAEARIAAGDGVRVLTGGGDAVRLAAVLDAACQSSGGGAPGGVLSFGVAGGLAAGVAPGDICVADEVASPDGAILAADRAWALRLSDRLQANLGRFASADRPVARHGGQGRPAPADGGARRRHGVAHCRCGGGAPRAALRGAARRHRPGRPRLASRRHCRDARRRRGGPPRDPRLAGATSKTAAGLDPHRAGCPCGLRHPTPAAVSCSGRASRAAISDIRVSTWREKVNSAGRWFSSAISGAIGPGRPQALQSRADQLPWPDGTSR